MRLIDADTLYMNLMKMKDFGELTAKKAIRAVENAPTIDAVPMIRCRDCKYCRTYYHGDNMPFSYACDRMYLTNGLSLDDYCSRAERKEE